ncbi:MAG: sensor histidine kinase [Gammaproteobacteria bacterium]
MRQKIVQTKRESGSESRLVGHWQRVRPFAHATLIVGLAAIIAPVLQRLPHANLSLLFMTGVLIVAVRYGLWPSIYASVLSFLIFNYFFTSPQYTFSVSEEGDLATLVFFLLMASLSGNLAARMRSAIANREKAMKRTTALHDLTRRLAGAATREQVARVLAGRVADMFGAEALVLIDDESADARVAVSSNDGDGKRAAGRYDELMTMSDSVAWSNWPLGITRGVSGRVAVRASDLSREEIDFGAALVSQAAVALERVSLVGQLQQANLTSERERLRAALLSSVSHDLRTPLSSIIGSASSLVAYEEALKEEDKRALLQSVLEESERLDRYIQNLLDMTRLGQGMLQLRWDWEDTLDLVSAASRRLRLPSRGIHLKTDVSRYAQFIYVHGDLIEQALVNLLENAARYSPPGATIVVRALRKNGEVHIEIRDEGPGIPEDKREKIFDPFYRISKQDSQSGTGLGLTICRGIIRAHGGEIEADSPADGRGALFRIRIPQSQTYPAAS